MNWSEYLSVMERDAIKTDDMATEDAYFMATHMPFDQLEVIMGGQTSAKPRLMSEDDVFQQLICNPNNQHRLIIVRGNNGTGKSHLIRYLKAKLESSPATVYNPDTEQLVFLRRLNNSVRGAFNQLIEQNVIQDPVIEEKIRKFVASSDSKDEASFKNDILYSYIAAVKSDRSEEIYRAVECRDIAAYLSDSRVQERLMRPGGAISRCYSVITAPSNQVLTENTIFTEEDFNDRKILKAVINQGDPQAVDFALTLKGDPEEVERLINYLNRFTRDVVQRCADISSESTKSVFEHLRKDLKTQGKNLTIFIEDFTGFTGIDSELITVLSTEHGGAYDYLCRVTAIIGITDGYYDQFKDNFKDRVTHQVSVTERSYSSEGFLTRMAAHYLNAIYCNRSDIEAWSQSGAEPDALPISDFKPPCDWETARIGQKDVTLYPFTSKAIMTLYEKLPVKSPRMFLRQVIRDELKEYFDGQIYDDENLFPINIGYTQMTNGAHSSAIDRDDSLSPADKERLKSVLAIWGDGSAAASDEDGKEFIGGVNRAFLKEIGLGAYSGIGGARKNESVAPETKGPKQAESAQTSSDISAQPKKKSLDGPTKNYLNWLQDIDDWYSRNQELKYHADYRGEIRDFLRGSGSTVGAINWQDIGIPAYIASERLSDIGCIYIEGQLESVPKEKAFITLTRSAEDRDAILALMEHRYARSWDFENAPYYQQRLITWLERKKPELIRNLSGQGSEAPPQIPKWCLALQYFQALLLRADVDTSSPATMMKDLLGPVVPKAQMKYATREWEDVSGFVSKSRSEFDSARTLLQKASLTVMGAVQGSKNDAIKKVYRTGELFQALSDLEGCHWDIESELPENVPSNLLYNPAALLKKLYFRIRKVLDSEKTLYHETKGKLIATIGPLDQDNLVDVLASIQDLFSEFAASKIHVSETLRIQYEHPPIETAKSVLAICNHLSAADGASFIEQLRAYSSEDLIRLKGFLGDMQEIERIALDEEKKATKELKSMTAGTNLDEISEHALNALDELAGMLEVEEVQDDF